MTGYNGRFIAVASIAVAFLAGCSIHSTKSGEEKNVSISSPLGGLKVRTDNVDVKDTGLPVYPGARLKPESNEHDKGKANVNIDTPWFGLKVVALTYLSDDPQDKVWDFYKKEMSKYGRVLECKPGSADMSKDEGKNKGELTCDDKHGKKHGMNINAEDTQLKVGTDDHQRIVGFKRSGDATQFSLVYVVTHGENKDSI
jgi:hypothetical protein